MKQLSTVCRNCGAFALIALAPLALRAQPPMPTDSWPTYNGDFTGRRFSPLTKINANNINSLTLAWTWRLNASGGSSFGGSPMDFGNVR